MSQNIRDNIFYISVLLLSRQPFPVHFEVYICPSRPLLFLCSAAVFGVNTDAAGVAAVETKKKKKEKEKSLCGSCSSTACQVNIIMHIRSASSRREEG